MEETTLKEGSDGGKRGEPVPGAVALVGSRSFQLAALSVSPLLHLKLFFLQGPCAFVSMKCGSNVLGEREESYIAGKRDQMSLKSSKLSLFLKKLLFHCCQI